jgi:chemotaxis protein methyltransferase CheR
VKIHLSSLVDRVAAISANASGLWVAGERPSHLARRLEGYIDAHGFELLEALVKQSEQGDPQALQELRNALTVNYTHFWRDPDHFLYLQEHLTTRLRTLVQKKISGGKPLLRMLSAGCASGEEAWSMAITAAEAVRQSRIEAEVEILAVDIDTSAIEVALSGQYRAEMIQQLPQDLRDRYLQPVMHQHRSLWQVNQQLKSMVRFSRVDLLAQYWPSCEEGKRFDAIFCRNVIIYLSKSARIHIFEKFSSIIEPSGILIFSRVEGGINLAEPYFKPCGDSVYLPGVIRSRISD